MLLGIEVTQASDVELLTVILGKRRTAETLLQKAGVPSSPSSSQCRRKGERCLARKVQAATRPTRP